MDKLSNRYLNEVVDWNKKFNLTGLKTFDDIKEKLYDDSLNIARAADLSKKIRVIDIGCGAGFPGLPLKIEFPDIELTLVDSVAKKIDFVEHIISMLCLKDTRAVCGRAEDLARNKDYRDSFDICLSRGVAKLNILAEYCLPFVKAGGRFIASKGAGIEEELTAAKSAISQLGGKIAAKIEVPSGCLVVIKKIAPTPEAFPRRTGIPSKRPL